MEFKVKPYSHQLEAFERFKKLDYFALFMEMGTGKSKVAIDIASYLFKEDKIDAVLLIAPNGVHRQWATDQIPTHCPIRHRIYTWDSRKHYSRVYQSIWKTFTEDDSLKWFCTNVEYYSIFTYKQLFINFLKQHRSFIIVDESTRIKNPKAKRTINITELSKLSVCRTILTGTPVTQSPIDIWAQFNFLKNNFFGRSYFVFQHHHAIMVRDMNNYTGKMYHRLITLKEYNLVKYYLEKSNWDEERIAAQTGVSEKNIEYIKQQSEFTQYKNLEEIKEKINSASFFVKKEECLDLPPKIYETILVEPSKEQKKIYDDLRKELLAKYKDRELTVFNKVTLTMRLMQVCGGFFPTIDLDSKKPKTENVPIGSKNRKIERLKDDLYEIGDERVIIWSHFIAEIELLEKELKKEFINWEIRSYYGHTSKEDRSNIISDFQAGKIKLLICNQQSGSFGLNLQRSNLHYFFSNDFSLEHRLQAEDRSHRSGQNFPVCYKDILVTGTIEEKIVEKLQQKKALLNYFRDTPWRELLK
jgi:SNF2 family DNA or RNA helicase